MVNFTWLNLQWNLQDRIRRINEPTFRGLLLFSIVVVVRSSTTCLSSLVDSISRGKIEVTFLHEDYIPTPTWLFSRILPLYFIISYHTYIPCVYCASDKKKGPGKSKIKAIFFPNKTLVVAVNAHHQAAGSHITTQHHWAFSWMC